MSWGKILTGVAIGVGAIAAAPFTGGGSLVGGATLAASLTGAGTIAAATVAGVTGAAIASNISDSDEEKGREQGKIEAEAEYTIKMEKLEKKLTSAFAGVENHFNAIIALEAVGVACAACDGDFSEKEKEEIGEFVKGMMAQNIPENVKEKIQAVYDNPPTVEEAFILAEESEVELSVYEDVIQFVMQIDGVKEEEEAFVYAWDQLKEEAVA